MDEELDAELPIARQQAVRVVDDRERADVRALMATLVLAGDVARRPPRGIRARPGWRRR
jgi:hypothetical protein